MLSDDIKKRMEYIDSQLDDEDISDESKSRFLKEKSYLLQIIQLETSLKEHKELIGELYEFFEGIRGRVENINGGEYEEWDSLMSKIKGSYDNKN